MAGLVPGLQLLMSMNTAPEPTLRLIIAYKLVRAGAALLAGLTFLGLVVTHLDVPLRAAALRLEDQTANAVAAAGSGMLLWAVEPSHILGVGSLLTLDGLVTFIEGWALLRGWRWGVWLVVVASSLLIPVEIGALIDEVTVFRVVVLVINAFIVGWLLRQRWLAFVNQA